MSLFDWFADRRKTAPTVRNAQEVNEDDGLWSKCPECGLVVYRKDLLANASVCKGCGYHHRIDSEERIPRTPWPSRTAAVTPIVCATASAARGCVMRWCAGSAVLRAYPSPLE